MPLLTSDAANTPVSVMKLLDDILIFKETTYNDHVIVINHHQLKNNHSHDVAHEGNRYRYTYITCNGTKINEQLWVLRGCSRHPIHDDDLMNLCHAAVASAISKRVKAPFTHHA